MAKKTQREKDWPMITRLVEADRVYWAPLRLELEALRQARR